MATTTNDTRVISGQYQQGNTGSRLWTTKELAELRRLAPLGAEAAAEVLERSVWSVRKQAYKLRISLRPDGELGGRLLGQPRRLRGVREIVTVDDRERIERVDRRSRLIRTGAPLCPACVRRPQETEEGFCLACHLKSLAEAHALEEEDREAQRVLDRERQRKHRRKEAAEKEVAP